MTHFEAKELLLDLAFGELLPARALQVEQHVAGCAECQGERAQLASTRRMASPLAELEEPPAGFDDRILAAARAEASLRADGTPGAVIEVTGSVRPAGIEAAMVNPHAPVRTARPAARPRRALRWALGGSVAAAAALALAVSSSRSKRDEPATESAAYQIHIKAPVQQPEVVAAPAAAAPGSPEAGGGAGGAGARAEAVREAQLSERTRQEASQKEAQQRQRELGGGGDVSDRFAQAPEEKAGAAPSRKAAAPAPPAAPPPTADDAAPAPRAPASRAAAPAAAPPAEPAPAESPPAPIVVSGERAKKARAAGLDHAAAPLGALAGGGLAAKPARDHAAAREAPTPAENLDFGSAMSSASQSGAGALAASKGPTAAPASAAKEEELRQQGAVTARKEAPPPAKARADRMVASASEPRPAAAPAPSGGPASADAPAAPSPDSLEEAARRSRREANYALAAAQYRKAAQLRRGGADPSAAAWDLAHAVECLSAISQWDEARAVRRELQQLYPDEQSAASAAARALRPAELAPSGNSAIDVGK